MSDEINPAHYQRFPVEVIDITEHLNFNKGNAVKYLARAGHKENVDELTDLRKAQWYVNREIERVEGPREHRLATAEEALANLQKAWGGKQ